MVKIIFSVPTNVTPASKNALFGTKSPNPTVVNVMKQK